MACITISDLNIQEWGLKESIKPATRPSLQIPTTTAPMWAGRRQLGLLTSSLALRFRKRSRQQWLKGHRTFSSQLLSFMHINTHSTHGKTRTREWHHSSSFLCHRSPILNNRRADYHAGSLHSVQKEKSTPNPPTHSGHVRRMKNYYFKATRSDSSSTMVTLTSKCINTFCCCFLFGLLVLPYVSVTLSQKLLLTDDSLSCQCSGGRGRRHSSPLSPSRAWELPLDLGQTRIHSFNVEKNFLK